jgi:hypothetical protein
VKADGVSFPGSSSSFKNLARLLVTIGAYGRSEPAKTLNWQLETLGAEMQ